MILRLLLGWALASGLLFSQITLHDRGARVTGLRIMAEPTERPSGRLVEVGDTWSVYDFRDSLVVYGVIAGLGSRGSERAAVLVSVEFRAGRRVWSDSAQEIVDPDATDAHAVWFPSVAALLVPVGSELRKAGGNVVVRLGSIEPEDVLGRLRAFDPELLITGVRVRAVLLARNALPYSRGNTVDRLVRLAMGD